MKQLKVAFLWHQHQPYYKIEEEFVLPWVLLHGTKDYFDIPEVLYEFPNIKQTFNFAPSLSLQISEYTSGLTKDIVQRLTEIHPENLNLSEKTEIINLFFHSNYDNLISPHERYKELYDKSRDINYAISNFTNNDWMDLQVWYNLSWFGYFSAKSGIPKRLIEKGKNFTEIEKKALQNEQKEILGKINYQYRKLKELGQIEISCSPMFHPILPLLINSNSALESRPEQILPDPIFSFKEDAELQIKKGLEYFKQTFGDYPKGMWPSEGSISDDTLELMIKEDIKWVATDELVLFNSIDKSQPNTVKYFPRKFIGKNGEISILFRDHFLSDRIGFVYSNWNEYDAANDFLYHLRNIRNEIIKNHGEDALDSACLTIILDGENCWEYYKDNGIKFLRELFRMLNNSEEILTVTCSEAIEGKSSNYIQSLNHVVAGSWINANFDIWIGHHEDINAWNLLGKARHKLESLKNDISEDVYNESLLNLLIAEGSDWFWWYGPEHQTVNKPDFDRIFRYYIKKAYTVLGLEAPHEVNIPIEKHSVDFIQTKPKSILKNIFDTDKLKLNDDFGTIKLIAGNSAMHRIGDFIDNFQYGNDDKFLYIKFNFKRRINTDFEIKIYIESIHLDIYITNNSFRSELIGTGFLRNELTALLMLPLSELGDKQFLNINIETRLNNSHLKYPPEGAYEINILK